MSVFQRLVLIFVAMLLGLAESSVCTAGEEKMQPMHFTTDNGLPTKYVYSVVQDKDGYLWFATEEGVLKYNGYNFKLFNTSNGLPANDVWRLSPDSKGRIWVHSHSKKFGYIKDDVFKALDIPGENRTATITQIIEKDGNIYFEFVQHYDLVVAVVDSADNVSVIKKISSLYFIALDPKGTMYALKNNKELYQYQISGKQINERLLCKVKDLYFESGQCKMFSSDKMVAYFPGKNSIGIYDVRNCSYDQVTLKDYGGRGDEVIHLVAENPNLDKVIYSNRSLYRLDNDLKLKEKIDFLNTLGAEDQVSHFYIDNFRNRWYTTITNGILFSSRVDGIYTRLGSLERLNDSKYVGQRNGATFWWNKKSRQLLKADTNFQVSAINAPPGNVHKIVYLPLEKRQYYLTTLGIYKDENGKIVKAIPPCYQQNFPGSLDTFTISERLIDSFGYLVYNIHQPESNNYIASSVYGIRRVVPAKDSNRSYIYFNNRYPHMRYDSGSNLYWFYNLESIVVINPLTNKFITYGDELLTSLGIKTYSSIQIDSRNNVYVLANDKLLVYNYSLRKLQIVPINFNLSHVHMRLRRDKVILAGDFGIAYAQIEGPAEVSQFKIAPNPGNFFNVVSNVVVDDLYRVLLQTDKGFFRVQLDEFFKSKETFYGADKNFISLISKNPQRKIQSSDTISIAPETQKIDLDAINFYGRGKVKYRYSIDGREWQESSSGEIFLPNLSPDVYHKFMCVVSDDNWKSPVISFYLFKMPYWWQTSKWQYAFWVSGIIAFLGIILAAVLMTRLIVEKSNQKKRQLMDLELRAIHSQINPHFIFNTLGTALFFISKKRFDDAYLHVNKFSRLLRSYLKSSHDRYTSLSEEIDMLKNYIELQQIRFEQKINYSIEIDNKVPANSIQIPSLLLQPLVENAINHGLFHLQREDSGLLALRFLQGNSSNELICIIEDNGVGRDRARQIKKESEVRQESYGTRLTESLIDVFKKYEQMNIFLEYTDKEVPETGTIVKLTIRNVKYVA